MAVMRMSEPEARAAVVNVHVATAYRPPPAPGEVAGQAPEGPKARRARKPRGGSVRTLWIRPG
jgi:hypothetical protein